MPRLTHTAAHLNRPNQNLVDLAQFRQQAALIQQGNLASYQREEPVPQTREDDPLTCFPPPSHISFWRCGDWVLDVCASAAVIILTLSFAISVVL